MREKKDFWIHIYVHTCKLVHYIPIMSIINTDRFSLALAIPERTPQMTPSQFMLSTIYPSTNHLWLPCSTLSCGAPRTPPLLFTSKAICSDWPSFSKCLAHPIHMHVIIIIDRNKQEHLSFLWGQIKLISQAAPNYPWFTFITFLDFLFPIVGIRIFLILFGPKKPLIELPSGDLINWGDE